MSFEMPRTPDQEISELRKRVQDKPNDIDLQAKLLVMLERKGITGSFVPVVVPARRQKIRREPAPGVQTGQRWVELKIVYDANGDVIPGKIERILRVTLTGEPIVAQIERGHYAEDSLTEHLIDEDRLTQGEVGEQYLVLPKFVYDNVTHSASIQDIEKWLEENEFRGATLQELLATGSQFPEELRRGRIAALDEAWRARGLAPELHGVPRNLGVKSWKRLWDWVDRPLAVYKKSDSKKIL